MLTLNYFLMKIPGSEDKYMPNTKPADNYKIKDFLIYLSKKNREIPLNTYREVFKTMTEAVEDILCQGDSITIPDFMRISAVVKGVFDSSEEPFRDGKHGIGVNCTVLPAFIKKVKQKIKVKRIKTPDRYPSIFHVEDLKTKSNTVQMNYANIIKGVFFNLKRLKFEGLTILYKKDPDRSFIKIEKKDMELIKLGKREIIYTFTRDFVPPDWLVNGAEIAVKLRYKRQDGSVIEYGICWTKWVC